MADYYEIRHRVGFEETNIVGNVYYVNYMKWQGRCRELFLLEKAPSVLKEFQEDLKLFTIKVECEYVGDIKAFDELIIRMSLDELTQTQIQFRFDYLKLVEGKEKLVATGRQRIACMRGPNYRTVPSPVPPALRAAVEQYASGPVPVAAVAEQVPAA